MIKTDTLGLLLSIRAAHYTISGDFAVLGLRLGTPTWRVHAVWRQLQWVYSGYQALFSNRPGTVQWRQVTETYWKCFHQSRCVFDVMCCCNMEVYRLQELDLRACNLRISANRLVYKTRLGKLRSSHQIGNCFNYMHANGGICNLSSSF